MGAVFLRIFRGLLPGIVLVAADVVFAQPAAPPAGHAHPSHTEGKAIQEAPGEGDAGEAEAVMRPPTRCRIQARSSHGELRAHVIERPKGKPAEWYDDLVGTLRAGDLLYIRNTAHTKVTHVIMWVGECASGPDGTPLVIDSTGGRIKDANGRAIPCGIHLRPFRKGSWYHASFDHAHRWVK